ncbi:hypothetical protein Ciccas_000653 [Cichlidogyrus casuarinus]|uniref:Uncharacterized protein n=1 Tax=Cichlidogyrus casuarinus TaxID=1844966 RepID=A0ABD2QPL2_9PLAT
MFENKYGNAKRAHTTIFRKRICKKEKFPFSPTNFFVSSDCSRTNSVEIECEACTSNQVPFLYNETRRLPFCPQSTWLYKLVGGIFAVFIMIGFILILFRLLQSLECFNLRHSPTSSSQRRRNRNMTGTASSEDQIHHPVGFTMLSEDKLPDYDHVIHNPDKFILGPASSNVNQTELEEETALNTTEAPPAYNEAVSIGFIDASSLSQQH